MARLGKRQRRNLLKGLLFTSPWIVGLLAFYVYPVGASAYYSLTSYSILSPPTWVGGHNYAHLVTSDPVFRLSVLNSLAFAMMEIPATLVVGITIALLLNTRIRGMTVYRALYYMPVLIPEVAVAVVWRWVLSPRFGVINAMLRSVHLPEPGWLADPVWSKPSLVLIAVWGVGNAVVIYLAGLQEVPAELLDAAAVDGASGVQRLRYVSIPMITPVIFFNLIMAVLGVFQAFTLPYVLTGGEGAPAQSLLFYAMYLYRNAFRLLRMGRASAMAWLQLVAVSLATLIIFATSAKWVYYRGKEEA
jgi:multiple sugar transport system permease protein